VPGRGSGIGLSMAGGLGAGGVGGPATSTRSTGGVYGPRSSRMPVGQVHHYLWALVAIELGLLLWLRHAFRRYHGG
jgi:hypothetical protein